jgi:2Fe-2S ferredoxin
VCNGDGECSVCWVEVVAGVENLAAIGDHERTTLEVVPRLIRQARSVRLACQAKMLGPVTVRKKGVRRSAVGKAVGGVGSSTWS